MKELPFAITLEVGSSHANRTGSWRVERPVYVDRVPPCNRRLPRRGEHPTLALRRRARRLRDGMAHIGRGQPVSRRHGPHLLSPLRDRVQSGPTRRGGRDQRHRALLGRSRHRAGLGRCHRRAPTPGSGCSSSGADPSGLSAAYHLRRLGHEIRLVDSAPKLGGMMRYGIPAYRLPRAVLDAEVERIIRPGRRRPGSSTLFVTSSASGERVGFDAVFLAVGAQLSRRVEIPAGDSSHILDAVSLLHRVAENDPPLLGPTRRHLRRRRYRPRCGADGTASRCHRRRHRLSPQPRAHACPHGRARKKLSKRA